MIHLRRNFAGFQALLGETITGIVCSDRWSVYNKLPLNLHQICWAHLKRDFQKLVDRGGPAEAIGRVGLDVVECLFADWWAFRRGELVRPTGAASSSTPIISTPSRCFGGLRIPMSAATFCAISLPGTRRVDVRSIKAVEAQSNNLTAPLPCLLSQNLCSPQRQRGVGRGAVLC